MMAGSLRFENAVTPGQETQSVMNGNLVFQSTTPGGPFNATINFTPGTANTTDFQSNPLIVSFPTYAANQTLVIPFDVPLTDDTFVEGTEDFQGTIANVTDTTVIIDPNGETTTFVITDDDTASVRIVQDAVAVDEASGVSTFLLRLQINAFVGQSPVPGSLQNELTINITSMPGNGTDFTLPMPIVFPAGTNNPSGDIDVPFNINVNDDILVEGDEFFSLIPEQDVPNDAITTTGSLEMVIIDNDFAPTTTGPFPQVVVDEDPNPAPAPIDLQSFFDDQDDFAFGLTYTVFNNSNPDLVTPTIVPGPVSLGPQLVLAIAPDENGTSFIVIRATDPDGNFVDNTLILTVNSVNDAPSFTLQPNATVNNSTAPQTIPNFATNISVGPGGEDMDIPDETPGQTAVFTLSTNNDALFTLPPTIDANSGLLSFTPAPGAVGTATVTVLLMDDGGTTDAMGMPNGGMDTSAPQTFTITINNGPVIAPPPLAAIGGNNMAVTGEPLRIRLLAAQPGDPTQTIFTFRVNWRDGTIDTVTGPNGMFITHVYQTPRRFLVLMDAANAAGVRSAIASREVSIRTGIITPNHILKIGGGNQGDMIVFRPLNLQGLVQTFVNGQNLGANFTCRIVVFGNGGDDTIVTQTMQIGFTTLRINAPMFAFGGDGNDLIDGSANFQRNVFFGEGGDDTLIGGLAQDRLDGGTGNNQISGAAAAFMFSQPKNNQ